MMTADRDSHTWAPMPAPRTGEAIHARIPGHGEDNIIAWTDHLLDHDERPTGGWQFVEDQAPDGGYPEARNRMPFQGVPQVIHDQKAEILRAIRDYTKKVTASRDTARTALQAAGIYTASGELSADYKERESDDRPGKTGHLIQRFTGGSSSGAADE